MHNWRTREEKNGESSQKTEKRQQAAAHPFSAALCLLCEKSASLSSVAAEADLLRLGKIVASLPVNREEARISTLKLLQLNSICHFIIVTVSESDSDTKSWTKVRGLREDYCNKGKSKIRQTLFTYSAWTPFILTKFFTEHEQFNFRKFVKLCLHLVRNSFHFEEVFVKITKKLVKPCLQFHSSYIVPEVLSLWRYFS